MLVMASRILLTVDCRPTLFARVHASHRRKQRSEIGNMRSADILLLNESHERKVMTKANARFLHR